MNKRLQILKYIVSDYAAACIAWSLFYAYRKLYIEPATFGHSVPLEFDNTFFGGLAILPLSWILIYYLTGTYKNIYRRSRLKELGQTLLLSGIGVIIIFFTLLLDDAVPSYKTYYKTIQALFTLHFTFTFLARLILTSITNHKIHNRIIGFNTVLVGSNENALRLFGTQPRKYLDPGCR